LNKLLLKLNDLKNEEKSNILPSKAM